MKIFVANPTGFCFGVRRAVEMAERALNQPAKDQEIFALGELVHSPQVMDRLRGLGLQTLAEGSSPPDNSRGTVIIRAHGISPAEKAELEARSFVVSDATCPYVLRLHRQAIKLKDAGYQLIILGEAGHPEVKALLSCVNNDAQVITGSDQVSQLTLADKVALIAQTTTRQSVWSDVVEALCSRVTELRAPVTICPATEERQGSTLALSRKVDIMVVVGGHNSANTRHLTEICRSVGTPTYEVETAADLRPDWFRGRQTAGVTAGASTPDWILKEVVDRMEDMEKNITGSEEVKSETAPQEAAPEKIEEETVEPMSETDIPTIKPNQVVEGTVIRVTPEEAVVDIAYKSEGVIPAREISVDPSVTPVDVLHEGDKVKAVVLSIDHQNDGHVILSKRRADAEAGWGRAQEAYEQGEVLKGKVIEAVKGGLIVNIFGMRAFMPASLVDVRFVRDLSVYMNQDVDVKIIEMEAPRRRLVVSRKAAVEELRKVNRDTMWEKLVPGTVVEGTVQRLADFGAFVDLGGIDGLVHISELSYGRVNHPSEVLNIGDKVNVKILNVDREAERISLSYKQALSDPWETVVEKYHPGDVVNGKIMRTVSFGAFVEIEPGIEGLVHISQLANQRVEKTEDVVKPGDEVSVRIISVSPETRRISLSMRDPRDDGPRESREPREPREGGRGGRRNDRDRGNRNNNYTEHSSVTLGDMFGDMLKGTENEDGEENK
jgi:4-hydroxy-3-methylbut-2-enyl diphosphate reductase